MTQLENIEAIERRLWSAADTLRANSNYASNEYFLPVMGNEVLGRLLRTLNPEELKRASGDIFGRIYEYFLTQFADQKAHAGGEFFTPVSLVSLIANVLEPERGVVLDPACGSGGMFVQSAHFLKKHDANPSERLAFYGLEKNPTTIRLAKMNLAVHGLEGDIQKAITYYEDPHELLGKADFVMANPPFNVDEVDAEKVKNDPRLPFGLPGVNKQGKVSNANYLWISYFYSYLNEHGRAGFVMSSQASSAGRDEATVRRKLIETGAVEIMVAIRTNFFYTRTVPCELWFLNRAKPEEHQDQVLMIDARNIYRKVTRKIYDFSPEQLQNLLAIVWLYRGQQQRFVDLVASYLGRTIEECGALFAGAEEPALLDHFAESVEALHAAMGPFLDSLPAGGLQAELVTELEEASTLFHGESEALHSALSEAEARWVATEREAARLTEAVEAMTPLAERTRDLVRHADHLHKLLIRLADLCEKDLEARSSDLWPNPDVRRLRKESGDARLEAVGQLKRVRYFHRQARWLVERFPGARLRDVEGLVKLVDRAEIEANDWSLTPGRYVGVAPEEEDENFDFEEALRDIHVELQALNAEAVELAERIARNFEELVG